MPSIPPLREDRTKIGLIVPFDCAVDWEYWMWVPQSVSLHITRTGFHSEASQIDLAAAVANLQEVDYATRSLLSIDPAAVVFACTSSSFVDGLEGEQKLNRAMRQAGAKSSLTTSGALLDALSFLKIHRIALGTPYSASVGERLASFVEEAGFSASSLVNLERSSSEAIDAVNDQEVIELARAAVRPESEAVFLSCTGLKTIHLIGPLERELGIPVLTANQVTMWAALKATGVQSQAIDQVLFRGQREAGTKPSTASTASRLTQ
jgi:maleate isomerase